MKKIFLTVLATIALLANASALEPERRSWPRENAKNTKQGALILKWEDSSDFFPLKSFLDPLFAFFAFFCGHAMSEFGLNSKLSRTG